MAARRPLPPAPRPPPPPTRPVAAAATAADAPDLPTRRPVASFGDAGAWTDASGLVTSVAFLPGGRELATGASDGTVKVWSVADGRVVRTLRGHRESATCVAAS